MSICSRWRISSGPIWCPGFTETHERTGMNKEILLVAEAVSSEKGVAEDVIFEAMEQALAMATKKRSDEESNVRVALDRSSGGYRTVRWSQVVADDHLAELRTQVT